MIATTPRNLYDVSLHQAQKVSFLGRWWLSKDSLAARKIVLAFWYLNVSSLKTGYTNE